jgi:hypothetical protein
MNVDIEEKGFFMVMMIVFVLNDKLSFDKTPCFSLVLSTIFLYFTLPASAAPIPSGGYKTLIKIIACLWL